jgi:hypothetical protein
VGSPARPAGTLLAAALAAAALLGAGARATGAATALSPLGPWDRARGDLTGDAADEDTVPVDCTQGRTLRVLLRGTGPGRGAPTLRVLRPGGAEEPVAPVVRGRRVRASIAVDQTGEWTLVVGPPAGERSDWRLDLRDDGPRPADRALSDLRDLVVWKGNVASLLAGRCVRCHSGPYPRGGLRLTSYAPAAAEADTILFRMENGTMPPTGGNSPSQVDRVRKWIEDGLLKR